MPPPRPVRSRLSQRLPGAAVVVVVVGLTVVWSQAPTAMRWSGRAAVLGSLSAITALTGTALFSVSVVLSARLRVLERSGAGLDRQLRWHHRLGGVSFALLSAHPVLLAWRSASRSWDQAAAWWRPAWGDRPLLAGQAALVVLAAGLAVTVFVPVRHQVFVVVQRALGVALVLGAAHALTVGGSTGTYGPLRWYVGLVLAAGLVAFAYHSVAGRFTAPRRRYTVSAVRDLGGSITEVRLCPSGPALQFTPGQFAYLRLPHSPVGGEAHPFSMASPPGDPELRFTVKSLGDYTGRLGEVAPGIAAVVEGPYGRFSHRLVPGRRQVWIAGGIGIAPFLSMAGSLEDGDGYDVTLLYGYRDDGPPAVLDELGRLAARGTGLEVVPVDEHRDGLIDVAFVRRHQPCLDEAEYLLCGPPPMLHALRAQLHDAGVPAHRIHDEAFVHP